MSSHRRFVEAATFFFFFHLYSFATPAVENLRPPIPQDFRNSKLETLFDDWWHREPLRRPEFRHIADCVQTLMDEAEEGALVDVRRKSQRLSLSPQQVHSPEFPPVSEHLAMSFEQSPSISASSRECPPACCTNRTDLHVIVQHLAAIRRRASHTCQFGSRPTLAIFI